MKPDFSGVQGLSKLNQLALAFIRGNQVRHGNREKNNQILNGMTFEKQIMLEL